MKEDHTSEPVVSVVMGTYNQQRHVREALDSALAQTFRDIEIIVVDDASTDDTVDIIHSYGDQVRLIRRTENSGVCQVTRNMGIRAARGRYVAFLDHDDAWFPQKIDKQVAFMEAHPGIPLSHTYCEVFDSRSETQGVRHEDQLPSTGRCFGQLLRHCFITMSSVMVRRSLFTEIGYFNEDRTLFSEDYEFFLRVAKEYPIGLLEEVLTRYRKSAAGITSKHWRYKPESVPFHEWIMDHPVYWEGASNRSDVVDAFLDGCIQNAQYWRAERVFTRSMYFALRGLRRFPFRGELQKELGKSLLRWPLYYLGAR